jgi:hypothetical protein
MKATIDEKGVLTVASETPLESYALRKWFESNSCQGKDGATIRTSFLIVNFDFSDNKKGGAA